MNTRSVLECGRPLPLSHPHAGLDFSQSARGLAQSKTWRTFVASLLFLTTATLARAQSFSFDWSTLDGGGGTSTSADGRFAVSGTAGQPDAGTLRDSGTDGAHFTLHGGFWSPATCVQQLTIQLSGGQVVVGWGEPLGTCVLEYATELNSNPALTVWTAVPSLSGAAVSAVFPLGAGPRFFRIRGH